MVTAVTRNRKTETHGYENRSLSHSAYFNLQKLQIDYIYSHYKLLSLSQKPQMSNAMNTKAIQMSMVTASFVKSTENTKSEFLVNSFLRMK